MDKRALTIDGFADLYEVTEDGQIFSIRKQRYLKPNLGNYYDYVFYFLTPSDEARERGIKGRSFSAHRLVALTFIGPPPTKYHTDCHHKDHDRRNNHHSNLEWTTHSENILRSYRETNRARATGPRGPHSTETIAKMSTAKEKPVYVEVSGETKEYKSVQDLIDDLGIYRKAFNRSVQTGNPYKGMTFGYK